MNRLQSENAAKALSMVNEFYDSVSVADNESDLLFKKELAGKALEQLGMLISGETEEEGTEKCACVNAIASCDNLCTIGSYTRPWPDEKQDS